MNWMSFEKFFKFSFLLFCAGFVKIQAKQNLEEPNNIVSGVPGCFNENGIYHVNDEDAILKELKNPVKPTMVNFYAVWCGHCKNMAGDYEAAAKKLPNVNFVKVDCEKFPKLGEIYEIKGFPTMKVFLADEKDPIPYEGGRKVDDMVSFLTLCSFPEVTEVKSAAELKAVLDESPTSIVAYVGSSEGLSDPKIEIFKNIAKKLRLKFRFIIASYTDEKKSSTFSVEVVVNGSHKTFDLELNTENLQRFATNAQILFVAEINSENYQMYLDSMVPIGFIFYDSEDQKTTLTPFLEKLSKKTLGYLNFVYMDGKRYRDYASMLGLTDTSENPLKFPSFVAHNPHTDLKYVFDEVISESKPDFMDFIDRFIEGKVPPHLNSDPIPTENSGPVKIVVNKNFEEIVFKTGKDVLLELYTPMCGACEDLAPQYERLATALANSNVLLAKMNIESNDLPLDVKITPNSPLSVYLFPANDKENPILCESLPYTFNSLITFLQEKAVNKPVDVKLDDQAETTKFEDKDEIPIPESSSQYEDLKSDL